MEQHYKQSNNPLVQPSHRANGAINEQNRQWAMFAHLSPLACLLVPVVGNILGPLLIWQMKKDELPFAAEQAKEALHFQLSLLIYGAVFFLLCFVLIGIPLLVGLYLFGLVMMIVAAVKSNGGVAFRYPLTIRMIQTAK